EQTVHHSAGYPCRSSGGNGSRNRVRFVPVSHEDDPGSQMAFPFLDLPSVKALMSARRADNGKKRLKRRYPFCFLPAPDQTQSDAHFTSDAFCKPHFSLISFDLRRR